jgi:alpha-mannosidase/mannosylglycerate hydrolase
MMEVTVRDFPEPPLALTLFGSTRGTVFTDGEPGGQLLGPLQFNYFLSPLLNAPDRARLFGLGQRLSTVLRNVQLRRRDLEINRGNRELPPSLEFIKIDGEVVVTSIRQTDRGLEFRLFNPNLVLVPAAISLLKDNPEFPAGEYAELVDFEHQVISGKLRLQDRTLSIQVEPKKILTIRFLIGGGQAGEIS